MKHRKTAEGDGILSKNIEYLNVKKLANRCL